MIMLTLGALVLLMAIQVWIAVAAGHLRRIADALERLADR